MPYYALKQSIHAVKNNLKRLPALLNYGALTLVADFNGDASRFKGAVCRFWRHLVVEVANCNQWLSPPPLREATVADTGLRCRRLRPQRAMRFLYKE